MELLILDTSFKAIDTIDKFESLIWTDRYNKYGDFELCTYISSDVFQMLTPDNYIWSTESDKVMVVEDLQIITDKESGNKLVITGRSLESLLDRRIVWAQTTLSGNLQTAVQTLLNENVIAPTDANRAISNFIFEASSDPAVTGLTISAQFTGDNLYDVMVAICDVYSLGFSINLTEDNKLKFKLYAGKDRSYAQITNPYVIFSPQFNNIINSKYIESKKPLKTLTLVAGEGEGSERKTVSVALSGAGGSDLDRREMYTDARDISSVVDGDPMTEQEYMDLLSQRGESKLVENSIVQSFDGQMENINTFKLGEDYMLGDIVQLANEYGIESRVRITEIIRSKSPTGIEIYPTFSSV